MKINYHNELNLTTEQVIQILQNSPYNEFEVSIETTESYHFSESTTTTIAETNRDIYMHLSIKLDRIQLNSETMNIVLEGCEISTKVKSNI